MNPPPQPSPGAQPPHAGENIHATAISLGGCGVLIRGRSRSGKSALALSALRRAELLGLEAALVCDDQVFLEAIEGRLFAVAPPTIRGLIEVSGIGILEEPSIDRVEVSLVVDLLDPEEIQRMPEVATADLLGIGLRRIVLPVREAAFGADVLHGLVMTGRKADLRVA